MKKILLISTLILLFTFSKPVLAQDLKTWKWDTYGINFGVPNDFQVDTNIGDEFSGFAIGLSLTIFPWKDAEISTEHLAEATVELAKEMEYSEITNADNVQLNGFEGVYVQGVKDGVNALILSLLDPESDNNFYVVITFEDTYEEDAMAIVKSFQKQ